MLTYHDSPLLPIEQASLTQLLPSFVGTMVLDLANGDENQRWCLKDLLYDWDALDELPIDEDQCTYEILHEGWLRRSRQGAFSLSPKLLGQQAGTWEEVFAWLVCRDAQPPHTLTIWRIRIASLLHEGAHQELPDDVRVLRAQLNALIDVSQVGMTFKEMWVLKLRLALIDDKWYSLEKAGSCLGISREKARGLQARAVRRLHRHERFLLTLRRYLQCVTPPLYIQKIFA